MPREDLSEERQKQILEAAIKVFAEHGFDAARMEDIARESRLSKGAVYLYYKSKDALIAALMRVVFSGQLRSLRALTRSDTPAVERVLAMIHLLTDELDRMALAMPIMLEFYAVAARQASVREELSRMYGEYLQVLGQLIQQGMERGEFRAVRPEEAAMTLVAFMEGLTLVWAMNPRAMNVREQAMAGVRLLLDGLLAPPSGVSGEA